MQRILNGSLILMAATLVWASGCSPQSPAGSATQQRDSSTDVADSPDKPADAAPPATGSQTAGSQATDATGGEKLPANVVLLGGGELTSGIPGEGPLTDEEIAAWLDDPANHVELEVKLPLGLSLGQGAIKGLKENPLTRAKVELGRQLYFDRRLSADGTVSCADCHHPDEGYARHTQFGVGVGAQEGNRNSPASYNRILSDKQFWDGRAASLEEQAVGPIANPIEMANTHEQCVADLGKIPGYKLQFEKIFPDDSGQCVNIDNVGKAIAAFERVIVTNPSPFDYYEPLRTLELAYRQDLEDLETFQEEAPDEYAQYMAARDAAAAHPMSESARRGREIFFGQKGGCTACHVGPNLADEKYHNLGVGMDVAEPDLGRFVVTQEDQDRGAFKTPTIRNVELTPPYMHDGSQKTLEEVVEWYARGGHPNPHLSKSVRKLDLTDQDKADLVAFMKACTGAFPPVEMERLPQ